MVQPSLSVDYTQIFIDNQYGPSVSGKTIDVYDPRNNQTIAHVSEGDEADINRAVDSAYDAFHDGPWYNDLTPSERGRIIYKFADLIEEHAENLAILEAWDVGKPLAGAKMEMKVAADGIRYYAGFADKINGQVLCPSAPNFVAQTYREPVGVVGNILPWNAPTLLFLWHTAMKLVCGNTMVRCGQTLYLSLHSLPLFHL